MAKTRKTARRRKTYNKRVGGSPYKVIAPKIARDPVSWDILHSEFEENDGDYVLILVPLSIIPARNWNPDRYVENCKIIKRLGTIRPITIGESSIDGSVSIVDGNHRAFCAKELGYTFIPAFVPPEWEDLHLFSKKLGLQYLSFLEVNKKGNMTNLLSRIKSHMEDRGIYDELLTSK